MATYRAAIIDLLLPPRCLACGAPGVEPWCEPCQEAVDVLRDGHLVPLAARVQAVAAYGYAGPVAAAIRSVKVERLRHGARLLAGVLALAVALPAWPVTWVPAPRRRRRMRGLDLAEVLAGPRALRLLERTTDPADQTTLDPSARRASPHGTFAVTRAPPPAVVIVDDVRTTGATASAAAAALLRAGTRRALVVTLAVSGADRPGAAGTAR